MEIAILITLIIGFIITWIEDFIHRAYTAELQEYKWMYEELQT